VSKSPAPASLLVVGAGDRGRTYGAYALAHPDEARVVAVAEPDPARRERFACDHGLDPSRCFDHWQAALDAGRSADAVVIATLDQDHAPPAVAFAEAGWDLLLEKPMATTADDCRRIARAARESGVVFAVCHVLRYTRYTQELKRLIDSDAIGEVVGVQRLEPVGFWHFAHSYVRGNWRREADIRSVLLAKCCHDLDWLHYIIGLSCERVASFGALHHFRRSEMPTDAALRCVDCRLERDCPYSAVRLYLGGFARGERGWPISVVTEPVTEQRIRQALADGPYGRCVYACDNDVPDHQVVLLQFAGARHASLTMSAFTPACQRQTTIFGTRGWLVGDGHRISWHDFRNNQVRALEIAGASDRHGGGDAALMRAFAQAVRWRDPSRLRSDINETLYTHLLVFAAEHARQRGIVLDMTDFIDAAERDLLLARQ